MNLFDLSAVLRLDTSSYTQGIEDARRQGEQWVKSTNTKVGGALNKAQQGFTVFKGVLSNLVSGGINFVAGAIRDNLGGAISRVDTLNNYTKVMENLGVSATKSKKQLDALTEGIQDLPTTLPDIATLQQQFFALNGDLEKSTKLSIALNDAVLAGGQGQEVANRALDNWYGIMAEGAPDRRDWDALVQAMPAQLKQISEEMLGAGHSSEDLFEAWKDGVVTADDVTDALIKLDTEGGKNITAFSEQSRAATAGIETGIANIKTQIKNGIASIIGEFGGENGEKFKVLFDSIKESVKGGFAELLEFVQTAKEIGIGKALEKEIQKARKVFSKFAESVDVPKAIRTLVDIIVKESPAVLEALGGLFNDLAEWFAENGAEAIIELGKGFIKALPDLLSYIGQVINAMLKVIIGIPVILLARGAEAGGAFVIGILKKVNEATKAGAKIVKGVINGLKNLVKDMRSKAAEGISAFISKITGAVGKVKSAGSKLIKGAIDAVKNGVKGIASAGADLVAGIWNGISNKAKWLKDRISSWVGDVKSFLKKLFGISSPSKWARDEIGKMISAGLALGIENNAGMVKDAMNDTMSDINISSTSHAGNGRFINMSINSPITVNGAEDPTQWATSFVDALEMKARAI